MIIILKDFLILPVIEYQERGHTMKKAIISAKGLCKSFAHNGGQVHILTGMDIDIYEGLEMEYKVAEHLIDLAKVLTI